MLPGGCEVQAEQPSDPPACPVRLKPQLYRRTAPDNTAGASRPENTCPFPYRGVRASRAPHLGPAAPFRLIRPQEPRRLPAVAEAPAEPPRSAREARRRPPRTQPTPRTNMALTGTGPVNQAEAPNAREQRKRNPAVAAGHEDHGFLLEPADSDAERGSRVEALEKARSCGNAGAPSLFPELGRFRGVGLPTRSGGLRRFENTASATLLEAAYADERDDASRLAQRCKLRPHPTSSWRTPSCGCG